jgi:putative ABC transport system permease protein
MNIPVLTRSGTFDRPRAVDPASRPSGLIRLLGTTLVLAFREIGRHKLRSFLTTLGIIIGVTSVVTMVTLGRSTTAFVQQQIASLGANTLNISPGQGFGRGGGGPPPPPFKPADVDAIRTQVAGVTAVAPQTQSNVTAVRNAANWSTQVNGTTGDFFTAQQWDLTSGRVFTPAEEQAGKSVCVIGNSVRTNLFRNEDPVGQRVRLGAITCDVIGSLIQRGQAGGGGFQDPDNQVIMPIKAVQRRLTGNRDVRQIMVAVDPAYDTATVQDSIMSLLRERRNIRGGREDNFNIFDPSQIRATAAQATQSLTTLIGGIAAVSLLVGGIGIMNIMLVSVTERTREIGIRLAIGAVANEVLMQFLVEAVVLSCLGGVIGLLLAIIATYFASSAFSLPFIWDPVVNFIAFFFSALIGVVFGFFPARRAASLNPIDALRHE